MKKKALLIAHAIILLLVFSLFFPLTRPLWKALDVAFYHLINETLRDRPTWQYFWGISNLRKADWIEDGVFLFFFLLHIFSAPKLWRRRVSELLFTGIVIAFIVLFVNGLLFRSNLRIESPSPSILSPGGVKLSKLITAFHVKDAATRSFPGDHATTALTFATLFTIFAAPRFYIPCILYCTYLCIPRMITGAHGISDILVGSSSIVLLFISWLFFTPAASWMLRNLEKICRFKQKKEHVRSSL